MAFQAKINRAAPNALASDFQESSYWWSAMQEQRDHFAPQFEGIADVVIVGGGVTGLNAALELVRSGKSVAVFDTGVAGFGASSRNTGFLGRFLKKSLAELIAQFGADRAVELYKELYVALNVSMVEVMKREEIDCDFELSGRVVLARSQKQLHGVIDEFQLRKKYLGEEIRILDRKLLQHEIACSDVFCGGVLIPDMATIHPGKYHQGLFAAAIRLGVRVYSHAMVTGISKSADRFDVNTSLGVVRASDVIVATNGYVGTEMPWFKKRLVPFQGFAIATEEVRDLAQILPTNRSYTDADFDTMAIRLTPDGKRIITSGRTGKAMPISEKAALLRQDLIKALPCLEGVKVSFAWSGYCAAPFDTMPKVGRRADGVWFATGFTFMGMPQGSYFGRKIAFQVLGDSSGATGYSQIPFKSFPLYNGNPWFLRPMMEAMRFKDYFANRRKVEDPRTLPHGLF